MPLFLIPNAANLTGDTLAAGVTASSLTSVGTLTALTVSGQSSFAAGTAAAPSVKVGAEQNGLYSSAANTLDVTLNGVRQAQFSYTAAAVNYATITGSATGGNVTYGVAGSDTNISKEYRTKGAGFHLFTTNTGQVQLQITHTASAVNYPVITGSATGLSVVYGAAGSDANVPVAVTSKGSGIVGIYTGNGTSPVMLFAHTASAVNFLQAQGAATGDSPILFATGADPNVNLIYSLKGAGAHAFCTNSTTAPQFLIAHTASATNYVQATGAATGNAVTISASGSDSNIDFAIDPKGTGVLRFGAHRDIAAETVTGYITIKDSAGNTRKLAVVS